MGYWSNKNGQAVIQKTTAGCNADFAALTNMCLVNASGSAHDWTGNCSTNYTDFNKWILGASATNMAYMLSAQLSALYLNVTHGVTNPSVIVYNGMNVSAFISYANSVLCSAGGNYTVASGPLRTLEEALKNVCDQINNNGSFVQPTACSLGSGSTLGNAGSGEEPAAPDAATPSLPVPTSYSLDGNYPNPFNPTTVIAYQLPEVAQVSLKVYDMLGREVATLVNESQGAGRYEVKFDASSLASGIYIYQLHAGSFSATKKLLLMK